jgi:Taste receptor protein (TAS2R)
MFLKSEFKFKLFVVANETKRPPQKESKTSTTRRQKDPYGRSVWYTTTTAVHGHLLSLSLLLLLISLSEHGPHLHLHHSTITRTRRDAAHACCFRRLRLFFLLYFFLYFFFFVLHTWTSSTSTTTTTMAHILSAVQGKNFNHTFTLVTSFFIVRTDENHSPKTHTHARNHLRSLSLSLSLPPHVLLPTNY